MTLFTGIADPPSLMGWLVNVTTAVAAAGGVAAMAVPAVNRVMFPKIRETRLRDHVLWSRVLDDGCTVACTDGSLFQVVGVDGVDLQALDVATQSQLYQDRKAWIERFHESALQPLRIISDRQLIAHGSDVEGFPAGPLREIQGRWAKSFERSYHNRHYVIVAARGGLEHGRALLAEAVKDTVERLEGHRTRVLELGRPGDPSPLLSFLGSLLNPGREIRVGAWNGTPVEIGRDGRLNVAALNKRLADYLIASKLVIFDGSKAWRGEKVPDGTILYRHDGGETWASIVRVGVWGDRSSLELLSRVMACDAEMRVFQIADVVDNTLAVQMMKEKMGRTMRGQEEAVEGVDPRAVSQFALALRLLQAQGAERCELVRHQWVAMVFGRDLADLEYRLGLVRRAIEGFQMLPVREQEGAEPAIMSMLPPHMEQVEQAELMSANVAHFASFETPTRGLDRCDWGPRPVQVFRTASGSPYFFCFHESAQPLAVGHTLIVGGTNAGKTTLMGFLASSMLGYPDARVFMIDRSDGLYVPIMSFGGSYVALQTDATDLIGDLAQLNPLQQPLDASGVGGATQWVTRWLRDNIAATGDDDRDSEQAISDAVRSLASWPARDRKLVDIYDNIPPNIAARRALERWVNDGTYAYLFGGARDTLSFDEGTRLYGFDFTRIGEDTVANQAVLPYLSYRIETEMQRVGAPWAFFADEIAPLLPEPRFRAWVFKMVQEARRMRGVFVAAIQRVQTLVETGTVELLVTQCPNLIVFPNEKAIPEDYIDVLGLTPDEFRIVNRTHPLAKMLRRYVLLKRRGEGGVVLDVDLTPLGNDLALLQSGKGPADRLRRLYRAEGSIPHAVARIRQLGLHH